MKKVFGLDIGTRSIVGTVGYRDGGNFHVLAQRFLEHETRAMLDGQIHDIAAVGEGIIRVKEMLEKDLKEPLTEVSIAAAGRVLRTVTTNVEMRFDGEKDVDQDDMYELSMMGVQKAYEEFHTGTQTAVRFYCVGYTVMRYYINGYQMNNPEGHKARTMAADLIATFLPDDVVDGLYKAVEMAGLRVANLTLEPIAAIQVAIPERYRLLNMALVDVGAGTSDICITKEGTITAYGMIPVAGDSITDRIAQHCLVDFDTAERIKRETGGKKSVTFQDIMGISQTLTQEELQEIVRPAVLEMTRMVAERIKELNGDRSVSAVFVVGGGGIIPGYTEVLAKELDLPLERVAIRGQEVMQNIVFDMKNARKDSMMVTPIGICYSYYEQSNNFIFVEFNGVRIKLYDNGKLTVADAAIQSQFPNDSLFPKRGDSLTYTVNERAGMTRGGLGEPAVITVNGLHGDLNTRLSNGDRVDVVASTKGDTATQELGKLPEMRGNIRIRVNKKDVNLPKTAEVNGQSQSIYYRVKNGDVIAVHDWYTVQEIAVYLGYTLSGDILVNDTPAKPDTKVYDSFSVKWGKDAEEPETEPVKEPVKEKTKESSLETKPVAETRQESREYHLQEDLLRNMQILLEQEEERRRKAEEALKAHQEAAAQMAAAPAPIPAAPVSRPVAAPASQHAASPAWLKDVPGAESFSSSGGARSVVPKSQNPVSQPAAPAPAPAAGQSGKLNMPLTVIANGRTVHLTGKSSYVYVDIFDHINFDLTRPAGKGIVTKLNGRRAEYMENLHDGDIIEIYWE